MPHQIGSGWPVTDVVLMVNRFDAPGRFYGYPYCWSEYSLPAGVGLGPGTQWVQPEFQGDGTHSDAWCRDPAHVDSLALELMATQGWLAAYYRIGIPVYVTRRKLARPNPVSETIDPGALAAVNGHAPDEPLATKENLDIDPSHRCCNLMFSRVSSRKARASISRGK